MFLSVFRLRLSTRALARTTAPYSVSTRRLCTYAACRRSRTHAQTRQPPALTVPMRNATRCAGTSACGAAAAVHCAPEVEGESVLGLSVGVTVGSTDGSWVGYPVGAALGTPEAQRAIRVRIRLPTDRQGWSRD